MAFLMLTPVFFRALGFAFIWHSIYWGVITWVAIIWGCLILISPLVGKVGCGWVCFFGTWQDLSSQRSVLKTSWHKPITWTRITIIVAFFATSLIFFFIHVHSGMIRCIRFDPGFLNMNFDDHCKHVWVYDSAGAILFGLLLDKRWFCRNLCFMGGICAAGAKFSRLIPVVDTAKCNYCGKCDRDCLLKIPITRYMAKNDGMVTNPECIVCGKCVESCYRKAISIEFVWNRKEYRVNLLHDVPLSKRTGFGVSPVAEKRQTAACLK